MRQSRQKELWEVALNGLERLGRSGVFWKHVEEDEDLDLLC